MSHEDNLFVELDAKLLEQERLKAWRAVRLIEGGIKTDLAIQFVYSTDIDIYDVLRLKQQGCPEDLLLSILV